MQKRYLSLQVCIMRYQDDINTEHNMKSICHAASGSVVDIRTGQSSNPRGAHF